MDLLGTSSISSLTGPPFVSLLLNWGLLGALSIQVYLYFQLFPNEPMRIRALVYAIYLLETAQTMMLTNSVWKWLVSGFGDVENLNLFGNDLWISICVIGGLVAFLVQLFYAYRIRMFSQNSYIALLIVTLSITSLAGALGTGVDAAQGHSLTALIERKSLTYLLIGLWLGSGSACDVLIALSMCYYLRKGIQGIPFAATRRLISKLVRLTVETGTLTASLSVISLSLFYTRSSRLYWETPLSATAKLYSTTLMAVLNSRVNFPTPNNDGMVSWEQLDHVPATRSDDIQLSNRKTLEANTSADGSYNRAITFSTEVGHVDSMWA